MTILVQRKYSIYTKFLDTILQSEDEIREGESRDQAMSRVRRELDATADEWRKEAVVNENIREDYEPVRKSAAVIDYKKKEALEITLANCTTLEQVRLLKEDCGKYGLLTEYVIKFNQLNNG